MHSLTLSFYGIDIRLDSDSEKLTEDIGRDFSFFKAAAGSPQITIEAHSRLLPYDGLPPMQASYVSPRNVCYYHKGIKYIDYSGEGLAVYNKKSSRCDIYSNDYSLLYEISYMAILSLLNERLDRRCLHRVHGLGLAVDNKAILVLLEMGGGKTTLGMDLLLSGENIKLISEDSPLIDPRGEILPFPIRIGMHPGKVPPEIPKDCQRYFARGEFGPKILIDLECFKDKICRNPCRPFMIIIGRRILSGPSEIKPSSKYEALKEFIKNSVIGLGLYQGIEYIFQKGPKEIIKKVPLGISRLNNALQVISKSRVFEFRLSPDKRKNSRVLAQFIKSSL
ncbi:MAG: hypothetical protein WC321_07500 [Candidatus Omnitrophota bacterium]|jgi:hypothetical protein